jgi:hypothetical protein
MPEEEFTPMQWFQMHCEEGRRDKSLGDQVKSRQ